MLIPRVDDLAPLEAIASLKQHIEVTEEECAAHRRPEQEELHMQACSMVEALELQLEERLRQAIT